MSLHADISGSTRVYRLVFRTLAHGGTRRGGRIGALSRTSALSPVGALSRTGALSPFPARRGA